MKLKARNLIKWEIPEQVIKVPFKKNNSFNSTMMALILPVMVSKKNKQTKKKYVFYCSGSQIHINPEKTQNKHQNDFLGRRPTYCMYWWKMNS